MTDQRPSLSVIMPAYNEASKIRAAYETVGRAIKKAGILDYEILFVISVPPDGAHDGTPDIAEQIAKEDPHARKLPTQGYAGMGYRFREGFQAAQKDYVIMVPGANNNTDDSLAETFKRIGEAPVILTYTINPQARPFYIRFVSRGFVGLCNVLFGLHLKYYNGVCLYQRKLLQQVPMVSDSPAYNAIILVYLLKSGVRYIEMPQEIRPISKPGRTFRFSNVLGSFKALALLFWKIHFKKERIKI